MFLDKNYEKGPPDFIFFSYKYIFRIWDWVLANFLLDHETQSHLEDCKKTMTQWMYTKIWENEKP